MTIILGLTALVLVTIIISATDSIMEQTRRDFDRMDREDFENEDRS